VELATCLEEYDKYARLNQRLLFLQKYWYALAVPPFFTALFVLLRLFPNSSDILADLLIGVSLGWALLVVIYAMTVGVRFLLIRCPRCGWRFGPADQCSSCGLPRRRRNRTQCD
jgi:hypothetical protein